MRARLIALAGILALAVGLLAVTPPTLRAQEAPPVDGSQVPPWCAALRERSQLLTEQERTALQAARNAVLDARLKHLELQAELGLIPQEAAQARAQRIEARREAPVGLGPCWRLPRGTDTLPGAPFPLHGRGGGRGGMMGPGW